MMDTDKHTDATTERSTLTEREIALQHTEAVKAFLRRWRELDALVDDRTTPPEA
jgi:hypothetical protein